MEAVTSPKGGAEIPAIVPAQTALIVMHYQTDIVGLFPSVAPTLLANTRQPCLPIRANFAMPHGPRASVSISPIFGSRPAIRKSAR